MISCYCKKAGSFPLEEDFANYIMQEGYHLHDFEAYEQVFLHKYIYSISFLLCFYIIVVCLQMLRDAGFDEVISEDRTEQVGLLFIPWIYM